MTTAEAPDDAAVEAFIAELPDGRREVIERVDEIIRKAAPELVRTTADSQAQSWGPVGM